MSSKAAKAAYSPAVDSPSKCPRNRSGLRLGLVRGGCRSRSKVCGINEKFVRLGVERHVTSPKFSLDGFYHTEFVGSVFVKDVESAFTRGGKKQTCFGLINVRVYPITDGKRLEDVPAVSIHDGQHLVAPADKEAAMLDVHIHGSGRSGGSDGPAGFDGIRAGIQGDNLVFILDIVVNHALAISHGVLRPAAHGDCCYDGPCGWVDHGGVVTFSVHRKDMFGSRIVQNAIRISTRFDMAAHFQSLQVKYHRLVRATVADESPPKTRDERDAMHSFQIRDTANDRAVVRVHDFYFRVV